MHRILSSTLVGLFSAACNAEPPTKINEISETINDDFNETHLRLNIGTQSLDGNDHNVKDSAVAFEIQLEKRFVKWLYGGSLGSYLLKDEDSFSVRVKDQSGNTSVKKSEINVLALGAFAGVTYRWLETASIDVIGGAMYISAKRQINRCVDCPSGSLKLGSPLYLESRLRLPISRYAVELSHRIMFSSDLHSASYLSFTTEF